MRRTTKIEIGLLGTFLAFVVLVCVPLLCSRAHGAVVLEYANDGNPHDALYQLTVEPQAGQSTVQPETGFVIRRISDCAKISSSITSSFTTAGYVGHKTAGLTNGYSRWPCISLDGKYAMAFGTTPLAVLYRLVDCAPLGIIQSAHDPTGKLGDLQESKFSGDINNPDMIGYCEGSNYWRQNPTLTPSFSAAKTTETVFGNFGAPFFSTSDGDWNVAGDTICERCYPVDTSKNGNGVRVLKGGELLPYTIIAHDLDINGVDVSPSGKWIKADNWFFDSAAGARISHDDAGHGGWVIGKDGREWFVNQSSANDWIVAFDPATSQSLFLMRVGNWAGMHVGSDKRGTHKGWAQVSTYSTTNKDPLSNNVFYLELTSQKPDCPMHPSNYKGTAAQAAAYLKLWNSENAPVRLVRGFHMQDEYIANTYSKEHWAGDQPNGNVCWGCGWHATNQLELFSGEPPDDVRACLGITPVVIGAPTPTPTPTATPIPILLPVNAPAVITRGVPTPITWSDPAGGTGKITLYVFEPRDGSALKLALDYVKNTGAASVVVPATAKPGAAWIVEKSDASGIKQWSAQVAIQ